MLQVTWLVNPLKTTADMSCVHRFQLVTCSKYAPSCVWNNQLIFCREIMAVWSKRHSNTQMHGVGRTWIFFVSCCTCGNLCNVCMEGKM